MMKQPFDSLLPLLSWLKSWGSNSFDSRDIVGLGVSNNTYKLQYALFGYEQQLLPDFEYSEINEIRPEQILYSNIRASLYQIGMYELPNLRFS